MAKLLIEAGCDVNAQLALCAYSPLQASISSEKLDMDLVDALLKRNADIAARRRNDDENAIDLARERKVPGLVDGC